MKQAVYTKSLTIALCPEAYEQIKAITDECQISMADWVREAVDAALVNRKQSEESCYGE